MTLLLTDILTQSRICPCLRIIVKLIVENNNVEIQIQVAGDKGQYHWGRERIIASHGWIMVSVSSIYGQVSLPVARWIRYHQPPVTGLHYQHFINSQDF